MPPQFILLFIEVESGKIVSATFAETEVEKTMIIRECEDAEHYIKALPCDYSMRKDMQNGNQ